MEMVRSADGTAIACVRTGEGPPLVVVHGGLSDRTSAEPLLPYLAPRATVWTFDRRGRGGSGDTPPYAVEREIEDLAAVLDRAGGLAAVYGHSSGAILTLEAALAGLPLTRMVLYEPPFMIGDQRPRPKPDLGDRVQALVDAGDREGAVRTFLREGPALSNLELTAMRASPIWPRFVEMAQSCAYDARVAAQGRLPAERVAALRTPALVLQGGASPEWMRSGTEALAAALPDGRLAVLPGQGHSAGARAPALLAEHILAFV